MINSTAYPALLIEELSCRLQIHEKKLEEISKQVYENIGQTLSLASLQLGTINISKNKQAEKSISHSGQLVVKAIKDLRTVLRQSGPDEIIREGFFYCFHNEIDRLKTLADINIHLEVKGITYYLDPARELITYCILQNIVTDIAAVNGYRNIYLSIQYFNKGIMILINYNSPGPELKISRNSIYQKLSIISAVLKAKTGSDCKKLSLYIKR